MPTVHCQTVVFSDIQAILFDKDGTLAQTEPFLIALGHRRIDQICVHHPTIREALFQVLGFGAHTLRSDGLLAVGTRYENEIAVAAAIAATGYGWAEALAIAQTAFTAADAEMEPKAPKTPLFPGTRTFLNQVRGDGLRIGLLSADSSHHVHDFVQTYGLANDFQFVMGIDHPPGKPDPSLVELACNALGVSAKQMLVIGDSPVDINLAHIGHTAGCIAMSWGSVPCRGLDAAEAIAQSFEDITIR